MQKSKHLTYYRLLMSLILMTLVSCSVSQPSTLEHEGAVAVASVTSTKSATAIPSSATPAASETPTLTATIAPSPSPTSVATAIFTPTLSLIPLPTIPPQQRGQVYSELMSSNGNCELPCWWGFELGVASLDEVRQLYSAFNAYISEQAGHNGISVLEATFVDPQIENGEQVNHIFIAQDSIIIEALIDADDPSYQIEPLLHRLGQPSDIWVWTIPEPYEGILPTRFRLYYPEQGVFVLYATGGERVEDVVQVCFDEPGGITLLLWDPAIWDPSGTKGIVDRANEGGSAFTLEGHPVNEVSNWDAEQFFVNLTNPASSDCLETPSNLWSPP